MKPDIKSREDIYILIKQFYIKLLADPEMSHFFEAFMEEKHLEEHLATLVDFWDNVLFYTGAYSKNAMQPHLELHRLKPMKTVHFKNWLKHFANSVDENFTGTNAHTAKSRAQSIATVMQIKIAEINKQ